MALRDDPVADCAVDRPVNAVQQQGACVAVVEPLDGQLGKPCENIVAYAGAGRAYKSYPLGEEATGDEADDLRGRLVEPLRVVDDADKRLPRGNLGQQSEYGQAEAKAIGSRVGAQAKRRLKCFPLRGGHALAKIKHRSA